MQNLIEIILNTLAFIGFLFVLLALLFAWDERRYKRQREEQKSK